MESSVLQMESRIRRLQIFYNLRPELATKVLEAASLDFMVMTTAEDVRAQVMLPTESGTRIVVYSYGMADDGDRHLELSLEAGCSGHAWRLRAPVVADLVAAQEVYREWGLSDAQQALVPKDRATMISVPIFDLSSSLPGQQSLSDFRVIGTLSVDTTTPLTAAGWTKPGSPAVDLAILWADIVGKMLT